MSLENKFRIGDLVWNYTPIIREMVVRCPEARKMRRGKICDIEYDYIFGDIVTIVTEDLDTYSDYYYVFEHDKIRIRENKISKIIEW